MRSSAMMSFTLSQSLSGQRHPKSPPLQVERRHATMTSPDKPSVLRAPNAGQCGAAEVRAGLCPQPGLARGRPALGWRSRGPDSGAQLKKVVLDRAENGHGDADTVNAKLEKLHRQLLLLL